VRKYRVAWCSRQDYDKTIGHFEWQADRDMVADSVTKLNALDKDNLYYVERRSK
jgi:hypothetical protein